MLHWSQEASTGWTRNSWRGSIAKVEDVPFDGVRSRERSADPNGEAAVGRANLPSAARASQSRQGAPHPPRRAIREETGAPPRVDREQVRSYAPAGVVAGSSGGRGGQRVLTASEFAFLAIGL